MEPASTGGVVHLNVGGVPYQTSKSTLLANEESFFSSLLSGRFPSTKDANGAYFIDRDGDTFKYVLEYLRCGSATVPACDRERVCREAEFFCLAGLVAQLADNDPNTLAPKREKLQFHGGYFLDPAPTATRDDHSMDFTGILFLRDSNRCVVTRGPNAYCTLEVIHHHPSDFPALWLGTEAHREMVGSFFTANIRRGTYELDSQDVGSVRITVGSFRMHAGGMNQVLVIGMALGNRLLLLSQTTAAYNAGFSEYKFRSFE
eukprot:comp5518_c0_seq1/m.1444 comp5518_c0_seq1/g.1444  ORF comp5518_c0_seq1/g.1444 comp5518_c0_seq1/m.1444 type:complete len:260 (-) comp5518_c0_seq1:360-1139(-)